MKSFLLLMLFAITSNVFAVGLPIDVAKFVEQRDGCDHFLGEEPYDEERRQFLLKSINALCTGTDKKLAHLKKKYAARSEVMNKLNEYEPQIELGSKKP